MNLEPLNSCGVQKPEIISVGSPPPPVAQIRGSVTAVGWVGGKRRNTDEVVLCWSSWCHNFGVSEALNQECESSGVPKGFSRGSIFKHEKGTSNE